jgi:hypothetical protein
MRTKKIQSLKFYLFLSAIAIFSCCAFLASCTSDESTKTKTNDCGPLWASWELTFADTTSATEKSNQKSALENAIKTYVNRKDGRGNTSSVTAMNWTDNDKTHSTLNVYVESRDQKQKLISDSRAIRPPSRVTLSASGAETVQLVEVAAICDPLWASWDVTFPNGISPIEKNILRSALGDSITNYVNNIDRHGNACSVIGMNWTDFDEINSRVNVCVDCYDSQQRKIGDTTAVRPPSGVKPPAGLTIKLVE